MLNFLFDENVPRKVLDAVRRHNSFTPAYPLDAIAVGESWAPPFGTLDPEILKWIEVEGRLLVTRDIRSMPIHLEDHLANGGDVPGILEIRPGTTIPKILDALQLVAHAGLADDFKNRIVFVP